MKRAALGLILCVLAMSELYIASGYLPARWQYAIDHAVTHTVSRQNPKPLTTHPALNEELEKARRENPVFWMLIYVVITVLFLLNTFLLCKVWASLRGGRQPSPASAK